MSPASLDARAVVRALEALTTQVRRVADGLSPTDQQRADALSTPVVEVAVAADDALTTAVAPDYTSPLAGRIEVRQPCPWCGDRQMIPRHQFDEHVMRLHPDVKTVERRAVADQTEPHSCRNCEGVDPDTCLANPELTLQEARDLADKTSLDLYRAQDTLAFVAECCDIADREQQPITTALVREWLKGDRCTRQRAADRAAAAAVVAVLPADQRAAEAHRLALSDALGLGTGAPWDAIHERVTELAAGPADQQAELTDAERTMLTYALDQAQERIWSEDGFTDEDQAAVDSLRRLTAELRRMAGEEPHTAGTPQPDGISDLPERLKAALTERFTELGNPFSEMRLHEQGPDGWPASHPVGPAKVAEVLRELLEPAASAVPAAPDTEA